MKTTAEEDLQEILAVMAGADGCIGYMKLLSLVRTLSRQAEAGNHEADAVLNIVRQFRKLIDVAKKEVR